MCEYNCRTVTQLNLLVKGTESVLSLAFVLRQIVQCLLPLQHDSLLDLLMSWCKLDFERLRLPVRSAPVNDQ